MFARYAADGGSSSNTSPSSASRPAPPLQQDTLATEIVDKLKTQRNLPTQPQALSSLIRQTAKSLSGGKTSRALDQDTLAAASQIAMAQLLAAHVPNAAAAGDLERQLLGQSVVGIGMNASLSAADQSRIAGMIVNSVAVQSGASPLSTMGQMLVTVSTDGSLSKKEQSVLENAVIDSDAAKKLGPATVKFLSSFVGTLAKAQQSPNDTTAVATAQFDIFTVQHGDGSQHLSGAALDNAIGSALGMQPTAPTSTNAAQATALLNGTAELYSGKQLAAIRSLASQIMKAGGANAGVTALPVVFDASGSKGPQTHIIWRVSSANGSQHFVDDSGRIYSSMQDYLGSNNLGYGTLVTARNGHLTIGADGSVASVSHTKSESFWDKVGHYGSDIINGLAIAGAGVLTVAAFVGTDGMATPLLVAAWGSVLAGGALSATEGVSNLVDRADHGQSWTPDKDTWGDYVGIAAGLATPFTGGAAKAGVDALATRGVAIAATTTVQTGARVAGLTARGVSVAAGAYSGDQLASNWDSLSWSQKLEEGTTLGLGALGASRQGAEFLNALGSSAPATASTSGTSPSVPSAGSAGAPAGPSQAGTSATSGIATTSNTPANSTNGNPLVPQSLSDLPPNDLSDYFSTSTKAIWPSSRVGKPDFQSANTLTIGGGRVFRPPVTGELYLNIDPTAGADVVADVRNMTAVPSGSMSHVVGEDVPWQIFARPEGPVQSGWLPPGITETARVLKPGGTVQILTGGDGWLSADQFRADFKAAGFTNVQVKFISPIGMEPPADAGFGDLDSGGVEITATKPAVGPSASDG
ncbi:DUF4781 domain-containing protein [Trinickia acidisoli]|uniref:DUF4781 domain-containing protein n=1 Tax=Trinickia acidisoli TaxID=2767482 RepID=UPI001A8DB97C|nr:DUF4781 domain-containing protein [Trinickia acidisoli]